jgi:2-dehydro-3-deoxyphosphogluconate aldolase/(4S)-4-hydroxy-2-oxoglutarate aldolase
MSTELSVAMETTTPLLDRAPVIPVVDIDEVAVAVPLARALLAGGVAIIEVTLRTPAALEAVRAIADSVPELTVGVGTICTPDQARTAVAAGAQFLVSPGSTDRLLDGLEEAGRPFLAGTATPSDMLRLLELGLTEAKLFPASAVGGLDLLRAVHGPLPQLRFCPTGGITVTTAPDYLRLPNVGCVGGTWLTPPDVLAARDWPEVTRRATATLALR